MTSRAPRPVMASSGSAQKGWSCPVADEMILETDVDGV